MRIERFPQHWVLTQAGTSQERDRERDDGRDTESGVDAACSVGCGDRGRMCSGGSCSLGVSSPTRKCSGSFCACTALCGPCAPGTEQAEQAAGPGPQCTSVPGPAAAQRTAACGAELWCAAVRVSGWAESRSWLRRFPLYGAGSAGLRKSGRRLCGQSLSGRGACGAFGGLAQSAPWNGCSGPGADAAQRPQLQPAATR
jgi:hypothetical protein